jgi:hypothetical protein
MKWIATLRGPDAVQRDRSGLAEQKYKFRQRDLSRNRPWLAPPRSHYHISLTHPLLHYGTVLHVNTVPVREVPRIGAYDGD